MGPAYGFEVGVRSVLNMVDAHILDATTVVREALRGQRRHDACVHRSPGPPAQSGQKFQTVI